jgi:hypothetical protein
MTQGRDLVYITINTLGCKELQLVLNHLTNLFTVVTTDTPLVGLEEGLNKAGVHCTYA